MKSRDTPTLIIYSRICEKQVSNKSNFGEIDYFFSESDRIIQNIFIFSKVYYNDLVITIMDDAGSGQ